MDIQTDFLVIGSGVAGLSFALKVALHGTVTLVTKKNLMESNTARAQGGIASVFSTLDSFDLHIEDTLKSGDGLCDPKVVELVVKNGPARIHELIDLGVKFNLDEKNRISSTSPRLDLGREGGHSRKRIVHAKDMTGIELQTVLVNHVKQHENITILENHIAIDLITPSTRIHQGGADTKNQYCCGAYVQDIDTQKITAIGAYISVLATGAAGKVYLYTSNSDVATGDGIAMGYRAGASVGNMEFVQFHPTCLYHPEAKNFLISEAVRGEGAILRNAHGTAFMQKYDPLKDLACRDVVARAIDTELKKSGHDSVFLDISHRSRSFIKKRFPNLYAKCLSFGMDMSQDPIPVVPAAHYMCGGVVTDRDGRTDLKGLYAIGETACTGLHGANRLASNSLVEALVFADRAAVKAKKELRFAKKPVMEKITPWDEVGTTDSDEGIMVAHNWDEIRRCMWNYVGIVRSDKRLIRAKRRIDNIQNEIREYYWNFKIAPDLIELRNIALVAELIVTCALRRKESRGLHYMIEYPRRDDRHWAHDTIVKRPE